MKDKIVRLDVMRAKERPADFVFVVELWLVGDRLWHDPYALTVRPGKPTPQELLIVAHALMDDANHLWDTSGSHRPPKRKAVKRRRKHRR